MASNITVVRIGYRIDTRINIRRPITTVVCKVFAADQKSDWQPRIQYTVVHMVGAQRVTVKKHKHTILYK